ncbi:stimulator of interferon genes protein [Ixodes scapularis]
MGDCQGAPLLADPEQSGASPSSLLPPCTLTAGENNGFGPVLQRRSGRLPFGLFCLLVSVGIAVCLVFKQIQDTGVHLFVVTLTMVLALVLSQACYLVDELCHLRERHGGRCWPAVLLCLRFPLATYLSVGVLLLLSVLMALQRWDMVLGFLRDQWHLLLLMGLVCQLCTWWASEVQWQHQRERRESAHVGEGMAWSFYFGYIRVLQDPVPAGRGRNAEPYSLRERISKYEDDHGVKLAVKKLFILLPSSCYIDPLLGSGQDEDLEPTTSIEDVNIPRAGTKERIFINTVYKIRNGDGEPYYCLAEGATPLLTLHDMLVHSELSAEQQWEQMCIFYHKLKELLERHQACSANFLLVPYSGLPQRSMENRARDRLTLAACRGAIWWCCLQPR